MKKKNTLVVILVALGLLGGGYYFFSQKESKTPNVPSGGEDGAFSSIQDALTKSMSLVCEYTDERGVETKTYIKNGEIRISSSGNEQVEAGEAIVKDNKMYTWSDVTKEGFLIEMEDADTDEMADDVMVAKSQGSKSDFVGAIDAYREHCKGSIVSDSHFVPPTDVKFIDFASMFSDMLDSEE